MTGECATYKAICANLSMTKGGGGVGDVWCKITESELKKTNGTSGTQNNRRGKMLHC